MGDEFREVYTGMFCLNNRMGVSDEKWLIETQAEHSKNTKMKKANI